MGLPLATLSIAVNGTRNNYNNSSVVMRPFEMVHSVITTWEREGKAGGREGEGRVREGRKGGNPRVYL